MSFTRSFNGYAPPPRYDADAEPFTKAIIQEAAIANEPVWSTLETVNLEPPDADPANPASRDFTTDLATLESALYRIVWEDDEAVQFTGDATRFPPMPEWAPSVREVAALIRARTKVPGGVEVGTFNQNTRPTATEVESIIDQAADHVSAAVGGDPCNDSLRQSAGAATALLAAILIESSYWPEQAEARGSTASRLESLFNARMKSLTLAVSEQCGGQGTGGEEEGGGGNAGALAAGGFNDGYALIGRDYPRQW